MGICYENMADNGEFGPRELPSYFNPKHRHDNEKRAYQKRVEKRRAKKKRKR